MDVTFNKEKAFVFVVCGSREHLDTLMLSYSALRKKTKFPIFVVTDNRRNDYSLDAEILVDIHTPDEFNNHQASIWLKTSLHKLLPPNFVFAYLDSDVLAVGNKVDQIFKEFTAPIRFADDHCKLPQFSPYALNCSCLNELESARERVSAALNQRDPLRLSTDPFIVNARREIQNTISKEKLARIKFYTKFLLSWPKYRLNEKYTLNKRKNIWYEKNGKRVMNHIGMRKLAKITNLRWSILKNEICLKDGRNIYKNHCAHLQKVILEKWGIVVNDPNWQHWNGGVFIFSDESHEFMNTWHDLTMEIFKNPNWKTRDQGTLIATVWKFGLQNQPTLNSKWNLILDYHNQYLEYLGDSTFTLDGKTNVSPEFVHIYHHWGDTNWPIWNIVMESIDSESKS